MSLKQEERDIMVALEMEKIKKYIAENRRSSRWRGGA